MSRCTSFVPGAPFVTVVTTTGGADLPNSVETTRSCGTSTPASVPLKVTVTFVPNPPVTVTFPRSPGSPSSACWICAAVEPVVTAAGTSLYEKLVPATTTVCAPSGTIDVIFTCDSRSGARVLHVSPPFVVL